MLKKLSLFIIGITAIILCLEVPVSYAIYSPVLSDEVSLVKKHIVTAKQTNGVGDFVNVYKKLEKPNDGFLSTYSTSIKQAIIQDLTESFMDGLSLLAGFWFDRQEGISNCLRDDIWELQALQEAIFNELFKAVALNDSTNSAILWNDYQLITKRIFDGYITQNGKQKYIAGLKKTSKNSSIWFPSGSQNYYLNCPYTDFGPAWKELKNSFDNLYETFEKKDGSLALGSFASMKEAAKQKAARKAEDWFNKNQLKFTLGGTGGYSPRSLTNGPGIKGLVADIETELTFVKEYVKANNAQLWANITAGTSVSEVTKYVDAYQKLQDQQELITDQMETAIKFNLSLQNVSEANLNQIQTILMNTNNIIKNAYEAPVDKTDLHDFCNELLKVASIQCRNKTKGDVPTCN